MLENFKIDFWLIFKEKTEPCTENWGCRSMDWMLMWKEWA